MLRARRAEDKEQRRQAFLGAVKTLFEAGSFGSVTMADVARQAGLAKGTVFLYFPTKEALFLELLEGEIDEWLNETDGFLSAPRPLSPVEVATMLADSLTKRSALTRILALVSGVLEHNIEPERVLKFKLDLFERLKKTGALLDNVLRTSAGTGVHMLLRIYALVVGLRTLAEPGPVAREAMTHPNLSPYVIEFNVELREMLLALFRSAQTNGRRFSVVEGVIAS